jgi:peptide/nickel transport system substrate-binding protein
MKKDRKTIIIFGLILVAGLLAACGGGTGQGDVSNEGPSVVEPTEAVEEAMDTTLAAELFLDPAVVALDDEDSLMVSAYVYSGLMRLEDDGSVVPGVASECEEADDGLSYRCSLQADAFFTDGTPITADVVADNFNRWYDPAHPLHGEDSQVYKGWIEYFRGFKDEVDAEGKKVSLFDGIEKVNDLTILIHLFEPMPDFLEVIASPHFSILNTATLELEGDTYGTKYGSVVSSGPYLIAIFSDWNDSDLTLTPNEGYWGTMVTEVLEYTFE